MPGKIYRRQPVNPGSGGQRLSLRTPIVVELGIGGEHLPNIDLDANLPFLKPRLRDAQGSL